MQIYHLKRRRLALLLAIIFIVLGATVLLAGCFHRDAEDSDAVLLADDGQRIAFLENLGWTVDPTPVETLDLELPQPLNDAWAGYAQLQAQQGFPFADFAGATVQRYTYNITNYPDIESGVQANLYLCEDVLIGGDVIFTGQGGFQRDLNYPATARE